ncbi:hypothetical protein K0504_01375 [Neiella marina]|uniref:Uncharacterized protein n=1 Tax=Neiella holothuriorum TaxID=2870530 RepID=A0ABS7EBG3_9GAMM|nr:hypothetical protein [Neiella holothuriorum]MBW8189672.1 hypothetical protein [Neiella holothuriorum]
MLDREYYRASELKRLYGIELEDIRYWIERGHIPLLFYRTQGTFFIGDPYQQPIFFGHACVFYDGLVELPKWRSVELLKEGEAQSTILFLKERERIEFIDTVCPEVVYPPNRHIRGWVEKDPEDIEGDDFFALEHHKIIPENGGTEAEIWDAIARDGKAPSWKAKFIGESYSLSEICITHENLQELMGFEGDSSESSVTLEANSNERSSQTSFEFANQFHELLARILDHDRTLKPKQVLRILSKEVIQEEDDRIFDTEAILLDYVNDVLVWRDVFAEQPERHCRLGTLRNHIAEVRRNIASKTQ